MSSMTTLDYALIAAATVGKVLLVAGSGLAASRKLKFKTSVKGISHITVYIFLPCLLFTRLVNGITWSTFAQFYWATLLAGLPICIGFLFSKIMSRLVPLEFHGLLQLGCTFQNAVSFALSVLMSLHGIPWLQEGKDKDEAQMYVFVYNITSSILLWSLGSHIVQSNKKLEEEQLAAAQSPTSVGPPKGQEDPLGPPPSFSARAKSIYKENVKPLLKAPLLASFFGLAVALTPLRYIFTSKPAEVIMGGMEVLGAGTVPLTLFILGCNLVSDDTSDVKLPKVFIGSICFVRLILIPSIFIGVLHLLAVGGIIPDSKIFKLVMLIECIAPTAINSTVICSLNSYHTKEYTRTLLVQYVCAIASTSFWLTFILWYLD